MQVASWVNRAPPCATPMGLNYAKQRSPRLLGTFRTVDFNILASGRKPDQKRPRNLYVSTTSRMARSSIRSQGARGVVGGGQQRLARGTTSTHGWGSSACRAAIQPQCTGNRMHLSHSSKSKTVRLRVVGSPRPFVASALLSPAATAHSGTYSG